MKRIIIIAFVLPVVLSCNSELETRLNKLEKENEKLNQTLEKSQVFIDSLTSKEPPNKKTNSSKTVYAFVHLVIETPYLAIDPNYDASMFQGYDNSLREFEHLSKYQVKYEVSDVTSSIEKISDFNDEKKYKYIDKVKSETHYNYFYISDVNFEGDVLSKTGKMDAFSEYKTKLKSIKCKTFNTYKEASLARAKITP